MRIKDLLNIQKKLNGFRIIYLQLVMSWEINDTPSLFVSSGLLERYLREFCKGTLLDGLDFAIPYIFNANAHDFSFNWE